MCYYTEATKLTFFSSKKNLVRTRRKSWRATFFRGLFLTNFNFLSVLAAYTSTSTIHSTPCHLAVCADIKWNEVTRNVVVIDSSNPSVGIISTVIHVRQSSRSFFFALLQMGFERFPCSRYVTLLDFVVKAHIYWNGVARKTGINSSLPR